MIWNTLSKLNDSLFKATGDIKYALLSLSAERRATNKRTNPLVPATVDHFRDALVKIAEDGGSIQDPMQKLLNRVVAGFVLDQTRALDGATPVFKRAVPSSPLEDLIPELLPFDRASMTALKSHMLGSKYPTEQITDIVTELADSHESLTNLLSTVITLAFLDTYSNYLELNPALQFLGSAIQKRAARDDPDRLKSATLRDLIDALNDAYAKYMHEYNIMANAQAIKNIPGAEEMLSGVVSQIPTDQRVLTAKARNLAALKAGYIRYYNDLQKALQDFATSDEFSHHVGKTDVDGLKFTSNPYILPDNRSFEGVDSIAKLISNQRGLNNLSIPITLWNGEKQTVKSLQAESEPVIYKKYMATRDQKDVANDVIASGADSIQKATQSSGDIQRQLAAVIFNNMVTPDRNTASTIRDNIIAKCKSVAATVNTESPSYSKDLIAAFELAKNEILNQWGSAFKNKKAAIAHISSIFNYFALPFSPHTAKHISNTDVVTNSFIKTPSAREELANIVKSQLTSPEYVARYEKNEQEYLSQIDNDATQLIKRMGDLKSNQQLLSAFNVKRIEQSATQATQKALATTTNLSGKAAANLIGSLVNDVMDSVISAYDSAPASARSQVPIADFISFIYREYLSTLINEFIDRCMTSMDEYNTSNTDTEGVSKSSVIEEVKRMVKQNMVGDLTPRASYKGGLFRSSIYYILSKLYQDKHEKQVEFNNKQKQLYADNKLVFDQISASSGVPVSTLLDISSGKTKMSVIKDLYPRLTPAMVKELMPSAEDRKELEKINTHILSMQPAASIRYQVDLNFGAVRSQVIRQSVSQFLKQNQEDGITDWSDRNNPRPRTYLELGHLCGAFADPMQAMSGEAKNATPRALLYKAISRSADSFIDENPVFKLRERIEAFKKEILESNPSLEKCIVPFDINSNKISFDSSPFLPGGALENCLQADISFENDEPAAIKSLDVDPKEVMIQEAVRQYEALAHSDPSIAGLSAQIRSVLSKLPQSQLSGQKWMAVVEAVVGKNIFADELTTQQQQVLSRYNAAVSELDKINWEIESTDSPSIILNKKNRLAELAKIISVLSTLTSIPEGRRPSSVTNALSQFPDIQKRIYDIAAQLNAPRLSTRAPLSIYEKTVLPTIQFVGRMFNVDALMAAIQPVREQLTQDGAVRLANDIRKANGQFDTIISNLKDYLSAATPRTVDKDVIEIFDESEQQDSFKSKPRDEE